ncbi:MAG: hypothetical protein OXF56_05030 [Rhodobacteraceae bacterium]|nr:hypothetical protein [Paracoccaceae bacterium]
MFENYESLHHTPRQAIWAITVFAVLGLLLNTAVFTNWAREAPLSPETTIWLIEQADRIDAASQSAGLDGLRQAVHGWVEDLRTPGP